MTSIEFEALAVVTFILGGGTVLLVGLRMFLNYRVRRLGAGGEQVAHLAEQVDTLRGDLADTRADLAEVHERLDFAERLLSQARDEGRLPPRA